MKFSACYDRTTKIISIVVCLGLLAIVASVHNLVVAGLSLLVLLVSFAWSPRGYMLDGRSVLVQRLARNARIPLEHIQEARKATPDDFRGCIKLFGSGGLFGYYGLFSTSKLGRCTWYMTNRSAGIVVITAGKTALFSPDQPEEFLAALRTVSPELSLGR
jgi:hypothetical protein